MIRSTFFWLAAICLAIIPLLCIDIVQHVVDWKTEVREEIITVVQNVYTFNQQEKAAILDKVFERNSTLTVLICSKGIVCILLLVLVFYLMHKYRRLYAPGFLIPGFSALVLVVVFISVKLFSVNTISSNQHIRFLKPVPGASSLETICRQNFSGKVVYIDFWGTTCGPCLQEFRHFTQQLKDKYRLNSELAYLYIAQGRQYLWKQQIEKYSVEGYHVFLNEDQYEQLYTKAIKDSAATVMMPRYLIINRKGQIVETNARQPGNRDSLYAQLDKYLNEK